MYFMKDIGPSDYFTEISKIQYAGQEAFGITFIVDGKAKFSEYVYEDGKTIQIYFAYGGRVVAWKSNINTPASQHTCSNIRSHLARRNMSPPQAYTRALQ